jgi:hypothetical protein
MSLRRRAALDIWPHVDALDVDELCIPSVNDVRDAHDRFDHVIIGTGRFNALLVIVVDLSRSAILGHFLLDLNEKYGIDGGHPDTA